MIWYKKTILKLTLNNSQYWVCYDVKFIPKGQRKDDRNID